MLTQEALVEIHVLHRQGESIRAIAQKLNLSRNTVRRYLRDLSAAPSYPDRPQRATKLDPYKDYLLARIEAAKPHWIPATVLLREIQDRGYAGGITSNLPFSQWASAFDNDTIRVTLHCRIGSSEKQETQPWRPYTLHCRIGSSESGVRRFMRNRFLHCRIGSSEKEVVVGNSEIVL